MSLQLIEYLFQFFTKLPWRYCAQKPRVRPILDTSLTPVHKLPLEVILLINDYLSLEASVCLSLTCYTLYFEIGKQCIESLRLADRLATNAFLRLLERDLPTRILCPHCNKLHHMLMAPYYLSYRNHHHPKAPKDPPMACWTADFMGDVSGGIYPGFSTTIF